LCVQSYERKVRVSLYQTGERAQGRHARYRRWRCGWVMARKRNIARAGHTTRGANNKK